MLPNGFMIADDYLQHLAALPYRIAVGPYTGFTALISAPLRPNLRKQRMRDNEPITAVRRLPDSVSSRHKGSRKLLWVDDCRPLLGLYEAIFGGLGFEVQVAGSPHEALDHLAANAIDVAILDYEMPEMNGCALGTLIKKRYPHVPVILYSSSLSIPRSAYHCMDAVCSKTAPREHLLAAIDKVTELSAPRASSCRAYPRGPQRETTGIFNHESGTRYTA